MRAYSDFAAAYDSFMQAIPYDCWIDFVTKTWKRHGLTPELVLDLACGTGNVTTRLAKLGYDMIGVDNSPEMLNAAQEKSEGLKTLYLCQSMTDFELYGTVQAAICMCDSVNYLTKKNDLRCLFSLIKNYVEPGGLFIFDIVTRYAFEQKIAGNTFSGGNKRAVYIMESLYDRKKHINDYRVTVFEKTGRLYRRYNELHTQRAHDIPELEQLIAEAGLELVSKHDGQDFSDARENSERVFFVIKL